MSIQDIVNGRGAGGSSGSVFSGSMSDAFGRLRMSNPETLFDSKQTTSNQPLYFDDAEIQGSGTSSTYLTTYAATRIAVTAAAAGHRVRQTKRRFNYQPGKSQLCFMTFVLGPINAEIKKRVGMFDSSNGFFFGSNGSALMFGIRSYAGGSPTDVEVEQDDWSLDRLNGLGPSGITLDPEKTQILCFDFEWLGVGSVRMGFVINGKIIYCDQFNHANIETNVYMSTPNLPIRYEIINEGTGPEDHLDHICCSVISEGGRQILGTTFGLNRDTSSLSVSDGSLYPVIGLKLGSSYLGSTIELLDFSLICTSSAEYAWYLILNPTEAGTALSWTPLTNSSVEYTYPANVSTISGGTILASGIGSDTAQLRTGSVKSFNGDIGLGSNIDYTPDRVFLAVRRLTGATETFYASLNFRDIN